MNELPNNVTKNTVESIVRHRLPRWNELPDLDIYMDQVLSLVARYLDGYPDTDEKRLTSSMVNNYVKLGIMPAPRNKKYNREHLAHLIIICILKTVMPISRIGLTVSAGCGEGTSYEDMYNRFCDYYENSASAIAQTAEKNAAEGHTLVEIIFSAALRSHAEQTVALEFAKLLPNE